MLHSLLVADADLKGAIRSGLSRLLEHQKPVRRRSASKPPHGRLGQSEVVATARIVTHGPPGPRRAAPSTKKNYGERNTSATLGNRGKWPDPAKSRPVEAVTAKLVDVVGAGNTGAEADPPTTRFSAPDSAKKKTGIVAQNPAKAGFLSL